MKVILAKQAGFCFGVKRATQMAFDAAGKDQKTYTLGPIIHSPQVVGKLENLGIRALDSLDGLENGTIIIRSHGVEYKEMNEARKKNLDILDATCPFVKKAQEHVKSLSESGYGVVVVGDADHPEVQGIVSYGGEKVFVVASGEDVKKLPKMSKIGVIAQTTQSFENLKNVVCECLLRGGEIRVYNTICDATTVRQEEAKELAGQVDCMLVVGGFNSANTRRLLEVCVEIQPSTHHIETAAEIDPAWFEGAERVGVTAGASTPKWIIDEVMNKIEELNKSN
jgi:4-hydroxy-3-methylbut-2-enyl diphosphate reductase